MPNQKRKAGCSRHQESRRSKRLSVTTHLTAPRIGTIPHPRFPLPSPRPGWKVLPSEKSSQASSTMAPSHTSFDFLQSTDRDRQSLVCLASVFLPQKVGAPGIGASAAYFSPFPLNQGRSWPTTRKEYSLE